MGQLSTEQFTNFLFVPVFEKFREIRSPEQLRSILPFALTPGEDAALKMGLIGDLGPDFDETTFHIRDGSAVIAVIDTAFHIDLGLVNYSFLFRPRELLKQRAAKKVIADSITPYLNVNGGFSEWREYARGIYYRAIPTRSLIIQAKFYPEHGNTFGLAIIDQQFSGVT